MPFAVFLLLRRERINCRTESNSVAFCLLFRLRLLFLSLPVSCIHIRQFPVSYRKKKGNFFHLKKKGQTESLSFNRRAANATRDTGETLGTTNTHGKKEPESRSRNVCVFLLIYTPRHLKEKKKKSNFM